jgi:hypothetical protein
MESKNVQNIYDYYLQSSQGKNPQTFIQSGRSQKGRGIGSFLKGLFRQIFPFIKSGAKSLGEELLKGGVGVIKDQFHGRSLKESLGARVREAGSSLTDKAARKVESMVGGGKIKANSKPKRRQSTAGRVTKRTSKRSSSKKPKATHQKKKKKNNKRIICDIFD